MTFDILNLEKLEIFCHLFLYLHGYVQNLIFKLPRKKLFVEFGLLESWSLVELVIK